MLLPSAIGLATLALLPDLTNAAPVDAVAMGSKHNLYLVTCQRRAIECPLIILCDKNAEAARTYTAVAYYPNGPTRNSVPNQIATVSDPVAPWEGVQREATVWQRSSFSSNIDADAASLPKGQLAGDAKLDNEDFVCFSDGQTSFTVRDELDLPIYSCTADYWCPSIQV
ncbi:hypothetical protein K469DRAFT_691508 [Zopfia rhizophila CBS 207.26]|uniref:Ig-like domain-containing protein n=1 Tax=Zopfia rhizophila CBS 207.26 TaxID=1314779 RepID=A0A6A6DWD2_9PEZI|nr:hypothetical protein K469DRAFT_691508 [Zopfia rhizophila CBS 207.26]